MPKIGITAPGQHSSKNLSSTRVLSGKTIHTRSNPLDDKQYCRDRESVWHSNLQISDVHLIRKGSNCLLEK